MEKGIKQMFKKVLVGAMSLGLVMVGVTSVGAEQWEKPVYMYGKALTEEQKHEIIESFGYELEEVEDIYVEVEDKIELMGYGNPESKMYSSALIEKKYDGSGIEVEISREENITLITEDQYANAMITAGVEDARVLVDAPFPVSGESALTGIYKAYAEKGEELDKDRMEVAQEELETTSIVAEGLDGDDKSALDDAIIEIKQKLSELKEGQLTEEQIEKIISVALDKRGLGNVISDEHVSKLVDLFMKYGKTGAIDSEAVKQQLQGLADSVGDKLGDLKSWADDVEAGSKITNFFKSIWEALAGLFNK